MLQEHRSFKTGRVLVRSTDGSAKIADAGLQAATRYCQQSRSKRLVAAFEWASPELLLGDKWVPTQRTVQSELAYFVAASAH